MIKMDSFESKINNLNFEFFRSFSYEQLAVLRDLTTEVITIEEANQRLLELASKKEQD